jgi:hypothetical protein
MIKTRHLQLGSIKPIHVETLLRNKRDLGVMLRVTVPTSWPTFPEAFSLPINESREIEPQSIEGMTICFAQERPTARTIAASLSRWLLTRLTSTA